MSLDVMLHDDSGVEVFTSNISHNLRDMARTANIEKCLWFPNENGFVIAQHLIKPLTEGVFLLATEKARFEKLNSPNGWGLRKHFLVFCSTYLQACKDHPTSLVSVDR